MKDVLQLKSHRVNTTEKRLYATPEDFEQLFAKQKTELLRLSLHLTADAGKAERCLILAMIDCVFRSTVSKDRVHTWARRMVIRNAIRLVWGTPNYILGESGFEFHLQPSELPLQELPESIVILTLPDLDRLVFVICVLERYSILDCALLLGKSPQEVYDAIVRAKRVVLPLEEWRDHETTAKSPGNMYGALCGQGNGLEGLCGSILD